MKPSDLFDTLISTIRQQALKYGFRPHRSNDHDFELDNYVYHQAEYIRMPPGPWRCTLLGPLVKHPEAEETIRQAVQAKHQELRDYVRDRVLKAVRQQEEHGLHPHTVSLPSTWQAVIGGGKRFLDYDLYEGDIPVLLTNESEGCFTLINLEM